MTNERPRLESRITNHLLDQRGTGSEQQGGLPTTVDNFIPVFGRFLIAELDHCPEFDGSEVVNKMPVETSGNITSPSSIHKTVELLGNHNGTSYFVAAVPHPDTVGHEVIIEYPGLLFSDHRT